MFYAIQEPVMLVVRWLGEATDESDALKKYRSKATHLHPFEKDSGLESWVFTALDSEQFEKAKHIRATDKSWFHHNLSDYITDIFNKS